MVFVQSIVTVLLLLAVPVLVVTYITVRLVTAAQTFSTTAAPKNVPPIATIKIAPVIEYWAFLPLFGLESVKHFCFTIPAILVLPRSVVRVSVPRLLEVTPSFTNDDFRTRMNGSHYQYLTNDFHWDPLGDVGGEDVK